MSQNVSFCTLLTSKERTTSLQRTPRLVQTCPLFRGSTVYRLFPNVICTWWSEELHAGRIFTNFVVWLWKCVNGHLHSGTSSIQWRCFLQFKSLLLLTSRMDFDFFWGTEIDIALVQIPFHVLKCSTFAVWNVVIEFFKSLYGMCSSVCSGIVAHVGQLEHRKGLVWNVAWR